MKKKLFCLMFLLAFCVSSKMSAITIANTSVGTEDETSISGSWVAKVKSLTDNMQINIARHINGCDMTVTFEETTMSARCNIYGSASFQGISINVSIRAEFGADYTIEGDSIFFDYEGHDLDVDVYSVNVNADDNVRDAMDAMGISSSSIRDMLSERVNANSFRQLMGYIGESARYEFPDKKTLVLTDASGRQMQFNRKKGKKKD